MLNISKEQFDNICNKFSPNAWIKFAFKYFSSKTEKQNMIIKDYFVYFTLYFFFIGLIFTILNISDQIIYLATKIFTLSLVVLVLFLFGAVILNNLRIRKIEKELHVSRKEYDELVKKYYS